MKYLDVGKMNVKTDDNHLRCEDCRTENTLRATSCYHCGGGRLALASGAARARRKPIDGLGLWRTAKEALSAAGYLVFFLAWFLAVGVIVFSWLFHGGPSPASDPHAVHWKP
jgi:hypothetical protein